MIPSPTWSVHRRSKAHSSWTRAPTGSPQDYTEIGAGSARFVNADQADPTTLPELRTHQADGIKLEHVAEFGWATFVPQVESGAVPYLVVDVDPDGAWTGISDHAGADEHLDRSGTEQAATTGRWQFWRAQPGDSVWAQRSGGEDTPVVLADLPADATITGVSLSLGVAADAGISYADAVRIEPATGDDGPYFDRFAWSFEPGETVTQVRASSLGAVGGTMSPGASIVSGPEGVDALKLPFGQFDGATVPDFAVFDHYDGEPVSRLDSFTATMWLDPGADACEMPFVFVGVDVDGDLGTTDDTYPFVYWPCVSWYEEPETLPTEPGWITFDVRPGLVSAQDETLLDEFLAAEGSENAVIAPLQGENYRIPGGIAFTHVDPSFLVGGPPVDAVAEESTPVPGPALVDRFSIGLEGNDLLDTFDFLASSGGGFQGYAITVPAGGGTGSSTLPGGAGSITTFGNGSGGTFTLVPGGEPAGTPDNFRMLGQSWNITAPAGFQFDGAEVCLPYDEAALTAAGYDEGDLALVHYRDDGTPDDITTSIDTEDHIICGETASFSPFAIGILDVDRLAGGDRAATAAAISAATFASGAPVAYVATGDDFADALSGGPAAAAEGGPVLLVSEDGIPADTATELARLDPGSIVVLGGTTAISDDVVEQLAAMTDGTVTRLAGADRYATSAAVSASTFSPGVDVAYVATGLRFADALTGGAAAARDGAPVLLVSPTSIPAAVDGRIVAPPSGADRRARRHRLPSATPSPTSSRRSLRSLG